MVGFLDNVFAGGADSDHVLINTIVGSRSMLVTEVGLLGIAHPKI